MPIPGEGDTPGSTLKIDQALHGYRNGHELLATSAKLSRTGQRALLELSDLSGSAAWGSGFECYLSGYPVPGERFYALARTWLSHGGPRPGTVWTRTLLLTPEQLAIPQISNVVSWIEHPQSASRIRDFENQLEIPDLNALMYVEALAPESSDQVGGILKALCIHDSSNEPLVVSAGSSEELEEAVLYVWSLQWPTNRSRCSFCTGAISLRQVAKRPFNIQIVPKHRAAALMRSSSIRILSLPDDISNDASAQAWAKQVVEGSNRNQPLRSFLWRFGPELDCKPGSFSQLLRIFETASRDRTRKNWKMMLEMIGAWFPLNSTARTLKSWALGGGNLNGKGPSSALDRLSVLSELTAPHAFEEWERKLTWALAEANSVNKPGLDAYFRRFHQFATDSAGDSIIQFAASNLHADEFTAFVRSLPASKAEPAFELRPGILQETAVWESPDTVRLALGWLSRHQIDDRDVAAMLHAVLSAGTPVHLTEFVDRIGDKVIDSAFDVLNERSEFEAAFLDFDWRSALRGNPRQGISWLARCRNPQPALARLVLGELDPRDERLRAIGLGRWLQIANSIGSDEPIKSSDCAFVLAVGFCGKHAEASKIVAATFESVHMAVANGELSERAWEVLKLAFPKFHRPFVRMVRKRSTDPGKLLRRALVEAYALQDWPVSDFVKSMSNPATLDQTAQENSRTKSGRVLRRQLNASVINGSISLPDSSIASLKAWKIG